MCVCKYVYMYTHSVVLYTYIHTSLDLIKITYKNKI